MAIWTALAILIGGLIQPLESGKPFPLQGYGYGVGGLVFGLVILGLHIYFNNGMATANGADRSKGRLYEDQIKSSIEMLETATYKEETNNIEALKRLRGNYPTGKYPQSASLVASIIGRWLAQKCLTVLFDWLMTRWQH